MSRFQVRKDLCDMDWRERFDSLEFDQQALAASCSRNELIAVAVDGEDVAGFVGAAF